MGPAEGWKDRCHRMTEDEDDNHRKPSPEMQRAAHSWLSGNRDRKEEKSMDGNTKVTISGGGQTTSTTLGALEKLAEKGKIKRVEDLLEIHNDEQTTKELNKEFAELRRVVDSRASLDQKTIKGELCITIKYSTDSDTGQHEIEVLHSIKLPKKHSNKRKMYEDHEGNLVDKKPTKQTEMFPDNVRSIKKGV